MVLRDVPIPELVWWTGLHRAAHAVAYMRLGHSCTNVSLFAPSCSEGVVVTRYPHDQDFGLVDSTEIDRHLVALLAGPIASQAAGDPYGGCKMLGDSTLLDVMLERSTDPSGDHLRSRASDLVLANIDLITALATRLCIYTTQEARELALLVASDDGDEYASYQLDCLESQRDSISAVPVLRKVH
jgi:hypothetical protein